MKTPKIVVMYRVKNEERWIEKSIKSILEVFTSVLMLKNQKNMDKMNFSKYFLLVKSLNK